VKPIIAAIADSIADNGVWIHIQVVISRLAGQKESTLIPLRNVMMRVRLLARHADTNDTKMATTGETKETVADVLNAIESRINTGYKR
jgi:hypothetical protein